MTTLAGERHLVYGRKGRFAGWPANYGMWAWGDEIVVVFAEGAFRPDVEGHKLDRAQPVSTFQARSRDGGESWAVQPVPCRIPGNRSLSADEHQSPELRILRADGGRNPPLPFAGDVDFTEPELAIMCARTGLEAGATSWFYLSTDRAKSWDGPYEFPGFKVPGVAARTDWLALGPKEAIFLLTAAKADGREGRVFCAHTADGARSFRLQGWVGPEPAGYSIMPSTVRLDDGALLTAVRCHGGKASAHPWGSIDLYRSGDRGASWRLDGTVVERTGAWGNPPAMLRLRDGRLLLVWGQRDRPSSIRCAVSRDGGASWSDEMLVSGGGGDEDVGYPRVVQRRDSKLVCAYYWNDAPDRERVIEATVFDPGGI